ncbi:MAG: hypothetical protein RL226_1879 [Bacteroidota bacterium]
MSKHLNYIPQMDGLRAISVIVVMLSHWLHDARLSEAHEFGRFGVDLFFVISGFLLTNIVRRQQEQGIPWRIIIKGFFVKRVLRLFPAYYVFLLGMLSISALTGYWLWREGAGIYFFTYTANFLYIAEGYQSSSLNHIWSLCVEEQFYLFLPWVVLFLPRRTAQILFVLLVLASPVIIHLTPQFNTRLMVWGNFSTLGIGVLLALFIDQVPKVLSDFRNLWLILTASAAGCAAGMIFSHDFTIEIFAGIGAGTLVYMSYLGIPGAVGRLLSLGFVKYIGVISYGLYIYHRMIAELTNHALRNLHIELNGFVLLALYSVLVGLLAVISYKFLETPFLKLKKRFDF